MALSKPAAVEARAAMEARAEDALAQLLKSLTPAQLERAVLQAVDFLVAANVCAVSLLNGVAKADAERDIFRAEKDLKTCLRTLIIGTGGTTHVPTVPTEPPTGESAP